MAKIFKISGYFVDPNGDYDAVDVAVTIRERVDLIDHYVEVEEVDLPGEWNDDNPLNRCDCPVSECEKYFGEGVKMDYRKMWESLKAEIEMGVEEGRECGYNDPKHENFDKFWTYERILRKMDMLEELERK